jgi:hypothetical protein
MKQINNLTYFCYFYSKRSLDINSNIFPSIKIFRQWKYSHGQKNARKDAQSVKFTCGYAQTVIHSRSEKYQPEQGN